MITVEPNSKKISLATLVRIIAIICIVAVIVWVAIRYRSQLNPVLIRETVAQFGLFGPLIFILIYAVATVCFLPGAILTLSGGVIFGPIYGTLYNIIGAVIGATLAFLTARYFASDWVAKKSGTKLKPLMDGIAKEGWQFVAFTRLVPLLPFNLLNYALGLTKIRTLHYVIASAIFMLPGCVAYTYLGHVGAEAVTGSKGLIEKSLFALMLLAIVAFLPRLIKRIRKESRK